MLLPRILPLGALEETETGLLFDEGGRDTPFEPGLPEAMSEIARRMQLAGLDPDMGARFEPCDRLGRPARQI